jgi:hypothetical protein
MAPAKPLPFEKEVTSTSVTHSNKSKVTSSQTLNLFKLDASSSLNSLILENLLKLSALFQSLIEASAPSFKIPTTKALYQSEATSFLYTTFKVGIFKRVTGIKLSHFITLVISNL